MNVHDEFTRRVAADRLCRELMRAIAENDTAALERLGMRGFGQYAGRLSELMTDSVRRELLGADDFGEIMGEVAKPAHYAHHLVNEGGTAIQQALDKRQGIRLRVVEPEFNDGRLKGIVGQIAESDSENAADNLATQLGTFVKDMGNEFIRQNAEQRDRAGFKVTITRTGGAKCCPWCADRTGKWELANAPDGVFGCHDNCKCMVDYTNSRGAVSRRTGRGRFVDMPYEPPHRMTAEEAAAKGGFSQPRRLTGGENGGIIKLKDFSPLSPEKVVNHLRDRSKSWIESLTLEEIRSVMKYTQNIGDTKNNKFFERLNSALRGEKPLDDHLIFHSNNISAAIEKFKLNDDIICYRSTKKNYFAQHKIGDIFSAGYFLSSSASKKGALKGQFTTIIRAPKGSKCAYIEKLSKYPAQREVLFDKNCRYKVLEESNNYMIIEVLTDDR